MTLGVLPLTADSGLLTLGEHHEHGPEQNRQLSFSAGFAGVGRDSPRINAGRGKRDQRAWNRVDPWLRFSCWRTGKSCENVIDQIHKRRFVKFFRHFSDLRKTFLINNLRRNR